MNYTNKNTRLDKTKAAIDAGSANETPQLSGFFLESHISTHDMLLSDNPQADGVVGVFVAVDGPITEPGFSPLFGVGLVVGDLATPTPSGDGK